MNCAMGLDPSMTATGVVVIDREKDEENSMLHYECITTTPDKRCKLKSEGNVKRAEYVADKLIELILKYEIRIVCTELPGGSQSASAATQVALVVGAITGLSRALRVPVARITPRGLKKAITGNSAASKDELIAYARDKFNVLGNMVMKDMPKKRWEAVGDATCAYLSLKNDDIVLATT